MTDLIGQYEQYAEEFIVKPVFYNYFRSSASYRVRIALALKNIPFDYLPVHLNRNGGEQFSREYRSINPQSLVPVFVEGSFTLSQSLAIIEYLDEKFPRPAARNPQPHAVAASSSRAWLAARRVFVKHATSLPARRLPTSRCCCSARRELARNALPAHCTNSIGGAINPSLRSTAQRSPMS